MKIYIGADHAGYNLKEKLKNFISENLLLEIVDKGAFTLDKNDDYPDFVKEVATSVAGEPNTFGIVIGGSGQGEAICANKIKSIRAALFYGEQLPKEEIDKEGNKSVDPYEIVKLARRHNNANILSLGARFINEEEAKTAVKIFIETNFDNRVERHTRRLEKINKIETNS